MGGWKMWWRSARPAALLGLVMLGLVIAACGSQQEMSLEKRAQSLDKSLICPVCPGETIDQSQVELAQQMRAVVRKKLAEGWSRQQIHQFFVERYGESVLAAPPKSGVNLVAWVVPFAAVVAAAVLLFFVVRAMRRPPLTRPHDEQVVEQELEPYLSLVDQELGIPPERPQGSEKP